MRLKKSLCLFLAAVLFLSGCITREEDTRGLVTDSDRELWSRTMGLYLQDDLWDEHYIYDAGFMVMFPMYAAFWLEEEAWMSDVRGFMRRVMANTEELDLFFPSTNWLHIASLMSSYINLETLEPELTHAIALYLDENIHRIWLETPITLWSHHFGNMRERIYWILITDEPAASYHTAITSACRLVMSIAANLVNYYRGGAQLY